MAGMSRVNGMVVKQGWKCLKRCLQPMVSSNSLLYECTSLLMIVDVSHLIVLSRNIWRENTTHQTQRSGGCSIFLAPPPMWIYDASFYWIRPLRQLGPYLLLWLAAVVQGLRLWSFTWLSTWEPLAYHTGDWSWNFLHDKQVFYHWAQ